MKKIITLLLLFIAFIGASKAQVKDGWTTGVNWTFKGVTVDSVKCNNGYTPYVRYTYDSEGRFSSKYLVSNEEYEEGERKAEEFLSYKTYDSAGRVTYDKTDVRWMGDTEWEKEIERSYEYDTQGRLICYADTNVLTDLYYKTCYNYYANTMTCEYREGPSRYNTYLTDFVKLTYNANNILTEKDSLRINESDTTFFHIVYVYDASGKLTSDTTFTKKSSSEQWAYSTYNAYTHGSYGSRTIDIYTYTNEAWVNTMRDVVNYDKYGNLTEDSYYELEGTTMVHTVDLTYTYTYNDKGNPTVLVKSNKLNLGVMQIDNETKSEFIHENDKITENVYEMENNAWKLSYTRTYYLHANADPADIKAVSNAQSSAVRKMVIDGRMCIEHNGHIYTTDGLEMRK